MAHTVLLFISGFLPDSRKAVGLSPALVSLGIFCAYSLSFHLLSKKRYLRLKLELENE